MYRYQLQTARGSLALKSIAGMCTSAEEFVSTLNEVMARLMDRGGWYNTEWVLQLCSYCGHITWPRQVGTVLGIRNCCVGEFEIRNNWWAVMGSRHCGMSGTFNNWDGGFTMRDDNPSPLYNDITGCATGKQIRVYPTKLEDVNKTVVIYGVDSNGQPLQEKDANGIWRRGLTIIIRSPYGSSGNVLVRRITSATKELTQANVLVYEHDTTDGFQRDLALWEPSEDNGIQRRKFEVLAKMEFIPVVSELDWLAIDNFGALKLGFEAIRFENAGQETMADKKWVKAIDALNMELRNKHPGNQSSIRVNPVGRMICNPV